MSELSGLLLFEPLIKVSPWGGRKLGSMMKKKLPSEEPCGESWEIVDLPSSQSIVVSGPRSGEALGSLVRKNPAQVLGDARLLQGRFPVLFKFIDAAQTLSVQVHPNAESAAKLGHGARPKTEAWYILAAEPDAKLYLGLKEGVDESDLSVALHNGTVAELLFEVDAEPGEFYFIPSGLLHAIGGGILLAEIQQASDTTYRVFDWNRLGLDGNPRQLHVEQALASINFQIRGQVPARTPESGRPGVRCDAFSFEKVDLANGSESVFDGGRPSILACIDGEGVLKGTDFEPITLSLGQSCLLPAISSGLLSCDASGTFLVIRV